MQYAPLTLIDRDLYFELISAEPGTLAKPQTPTKYGINYYHESDPNDVRQRIISSQEQRLLKGSLPQQLEEASRQKILRDAEENRLEEEKRLREKQRKWNEVEEKLTYAMIIWEGENLLDDSYYNSILARNLPKSTETLADKTRRIEISLWHVNPNELSFISNTEHYKDFIQKWVNGQILPDIRRRRDNEIRLSKALKGWIKQEISKLETHITITLSDGSKQNIHKSQETIENRVKRIKEYFLKSGYLANIPQDHIDDFFNRLAAKQKKEGNTTLDAIVKELKLRQEQANDF